MKLYLCLSVVFLFGCMAQPKPPSAESQRYALKLVDQGVVFLRQGKLEEAKASFEVAVEIDGLPAAIDGLGCVAFLRGDFREAEKKFIAAYQMDHSYRQSLGNLALLYEKQGLLEKAAQFYVSAILENPKSYQIRNNYAVFLKRNGRESEARVEFLKAQALGRHPLVEINIKELS